MLQVQEGTMQLVNQGLLSVTTVRVKAQESGQVLDEEQLAFLADPRFPDAKAVLMANLSSYDSDVLSELNKLAKDFGKRFVSQMQLSIEQAFWLLVLNHKTEQLDVTQTPVEIEVPKELLKVHNGNYAKCAAGRTGRLLVGGGFAFSMMKNGIVNGSYEQIDYKNANMRKLNLT
ncbi:hypothetical protein Tco_0266873 [Tanacetum coccineum]